MTKNQAQQQQQQFKQKKFNNGQHFKRKHRKSKGHKDTISNQTADMEQFIEQSSIPLVSMAQMIKKKCFPLPMISNVDPSQFLPNYSMMTDTNLKEMLSAYSSTYFGMNLLEKFLDNESKVTFFRQLLELTNKLNYNKLQDEQWSYYYHLGTTEGIWTGRVSKKMALVHSMSYTYGRRKQLIVQRRKCFQEQLQEITNKIQEHMKQSPYSLIDSNQIVTIVTNIVDKDQYQLRLELERRRHILKFDAKDHQLVEAFYQLKPRQTEIHSAKIIWKAICDEQQLQYEIAIFKNWLSSKAQLTTCTIQDLALKKITEIIATLLFEQQFSSTTTIDTFINDTANQAISNAETIAQGYPQKANDEKQKIFRNRDKFKKLPSVDTVLMALEDRQMNMVQRAQYNIQQQLKSFLSN